MEAVLKDNAKVLVPNKEHKNFTETSEELPIGTILNGEFKSIKGLRRGKPFSYRVFITEKGQIVYSNNLKEMAETYKTSRILFAAAGAIGGYAYSKKKGCTGKTCTKYAVIGGILGYAAIYFFDKTKSVTVTESK